MTRLAISEVSQQGLVVFVGSLVGEDGRPLRAALAPDGSPIWKRPYWHHGDTGYPVAFGRTRDEVEAKLLRWKAQVEAASKLSDTSATMKDMTTTEKEH